MLVIKMQNWEGESKGMWRPFARIIQQSDVIEIVASNLTLDAPNDMHLYGQFNVLVLI